MSGLRTPGSDKAFSAAVTRLARTDTSLAQLRDFYKTLPPKERGMAWKAVYAATSIPTAPSVQFLEEVALSPIAAVGDPHGVTTGANEDPGAADMTVKLRAAMGLAQQLVAKTAGASGSVARVLAQADVETSRMLGVELFSRGVTRTRIEQPSARAASSLSSAS